MNYLSLIFAGHIGKVDDLRYSSQGVAYLHFTVAVNTERDKPPIWIRVSTFKTLAETCAKYLAAGMSVLVESDQINATGYLSGGEPKGSLNAVACRVQFGSRPQPQPMDDRGWPEPDEEEPTLNDIPF